MRTVFVINPKAGQAKNSLELQNKIRDFSKKSEKDVQVYVTTEAGDAERFVRNYCKNIGAARFIACGGDGTFSEVLNGVAECENAEIGIIPSGTGNDFCRNFPNVDFNNVLAQIMGETVKCDAILYTTRVNGEMTTKYCANMFNIGFDCNVADLTAVMKEKPFISGSMAYLTSIFVTLIKKKGASLKIDVNGKTVHNGRLLLTSIANGCYCGGGIKSNPEAQVNDGKISINIIKNVSRIKFIYLLPYYMKGTFKKLKNIEKVISDYKCKKVEITPPDGGMKLCVDGEIVTAGKTEFKLVHNAYNFVLPSVNGADVIEDKTKIYIQ